jgi:glycosyltransferase involved in cell wall biosynthesis
MYQLSVVTITKGDQNSLLRTASSFNSQSDVEWIVVSSKSSFTPGVRAPEVFIGGCDDGPFSAMNHGLHAASGKLVVFMNGGDEFFSKATINKVVESHNSLEWNWAVGETFLKSRNGKVWKYPNETNLRFYFGTNSFCHQAMYFETQYLRAAGGFSESCYCADWILSLALCRKISPHALPYPVAVYEHGGMSTEAGFIKECKDKHLARKNYGLSLKPKILDLSLQFIFTFVSRALDKVKLYL